MILSSQEAMRTPYLLKLNYKKKKRKGTNKYQRKHISITTTMKKTTKDVSNANQVYNAFKFFLGL